MTTADNGTVRYPASESESMILSLLRKRGHNVKVEVLDSIDSTNTYARKIITDGKNPLTDGSHLIVARTQTAGRGRLGRSFYSPPDSGLYMSLVYRTSDTLAHATKVTPAAAVAVAKTVEGQSGKKASIKWVNDVYIGDAKVCGILCESVTVESKTYIIIGIGVNISTESFPDGLRAPAASVFSDVEPEWAHCVRDSFAFEITARLIELIKADFPVKDCLDEYRSRSYLDGRRVLCAVGNESFEGVAVGIGDDFSLRVRLDGGDERELSSGEASIKAM